MAIMKFRDNGEWKSIAAFKGEDGKDGKDGAIQYTPGFGINISEDNVISSTLDPELDITVDTQPIAGSTNPVASGGVFTALENKANKEDIKTDTSQLTNGAGFITSNDLPKDNSGMENTAGYLTEESDPLFKASAAASITSTNVNNWNKAKQYADEDARVIPFYTGGFRTNTWDTDGAVTGYPSKAPAIQNVFDKIRSYGHMNCALLVIGKYETAICTYKNYLSWTTGVTDIVYEGFSNLNNSSSPYWTKVTVKFVFNTSTGVLQNCVLTTNRKHGLVQRNEVLCKTDNTSYTPTADYHPATKKYVDDQVAAGVEGVGGIEVEEDPVFMKSIASTITEEDITRWNNKADSGGIEQELDPSVPEWVKAITEDDINKWNSVDTKVDTGDLNTDVTQIINNSGLVKEDDLINKVTDAGFITNDSLSDKVGAAGFITSSDLPNPLITEGIVLDAGNRILNYKLTEVTSQYLTNRVAGEYNTVLGYQTVARDSYSHAEGWNREVKWSSASGSNKQYIINAYSDAADAVIIGTRLLNPITGSVYTVTNVEKIWSDDNSYIETIKITFNRASIDEYVPGTLYIVNANGTGCHSEGWECQAYGFAAHAEGMGTYAYGPSHAGGMYTEASGYNSYAGGYKAKAKANYSYAYGDRVTNEIEDSYLIGKCGKLLADDEMDTGTLFAVANGTGSDSPHIGLRFKGTQGEGKLYVEDVLVGMDPSTYTGFDNTKTQVLKHINGVFTWVDE